MTPVKHNRLKAFLTAPGKEEIPGLTLIYGEPYLIREAFKTLTSHLSGDLADQFSIDSLEGGSVTMGEIMEEIATFSFLVPKKIVAVKNIPLFQAPASGPDVRFSTEDMDHFAGFIETGIPLNHFLILTTPVIDKRKKIYKAIQKNGFIVDCSVPSGARKADLMEQQGVLKSISDNVLKKAGKTIDGNAFHNLVELTGFHPDLFFQNLEKLILHSGKNRTISTLDVKKVIIRDKKDPIFNLTGAFMDRDAKKTLFFAKSLFTEGYHPLQILKSLENQVRKLVLVKSCALGLFKEGLLKQMPFNTFQQSALPRIVEYDTQTKKELEVEETELGLPVPKKKGAANDLLLAPNPKNAYPVFLVFQKSENFSLDELCRAHIFLGDLDYKTKSSSFDVKTQIEHFIIRICR